MTITKKEFKEDCRLFENDFEHIIVSFYFLLEQNGLSHDIIKTMIQTKTAIMFAEIKSRHDEIFDDYRKCMGV